MSQKNLPVQPLPDAQREPAGAQAGRTRRIGVRGMFVAATVAAALLAAVWIILRPETGSAQTPALQLVAPAQPVEQGNTVEVEVRIHDATNLAGAEFDFSFDPALIDVVGFRIAPAFASTSAACLPQSSRCALVLGPQSEAGAYATGVVSWGAPAAPSGSVLVGLLQVRALAAAGSATLTGANVLLTNGSGQSVSAGGSSVLISFAPNEEPTPVATPTLPPNNVFLPLVNK